MMSRVSAILAFSAFLLSTACLAQRLKVVDTHFENTGSHVFLNGVTDQTMNLASIVDVSAAKGNLVRVFVHNDGSSTPVFGVGGVTSCHKTVLDVMEFLNVAEKHRVYVILSMFDAEAIFTGLPGTSQTIDIIQNPTIRQSYIKNCFTALMTAVQGHPALAGIEAINEPEWIVQESVSVNPCFHTSPWASAIAGVTMKEMLKFIADINTAVKHIDPETLTTVATRKYNTMTSAFPDSFNYFSDDCIEEATGSSDPEAFIDYIQTHTYKTVVPSTPVPAPVYMVDKPIVIGKITSPAFVTVFDNAFNKCFAGGVSHDYETLGAAVGGPFTPPAAGC